METMSAAIISKSLLMHSRTVFRRQGIFHSPSRSHFPLLRSIQPISQRIVPRCYSTATEASSSSSAENTPPPPETPSPKLSLEDTLRNDLEAKEKEIIDLKDRYLRSVAEFRNLQDRTKRDIDSARSFAISRFASDLVESVDNLDRALGTVSEEKVASKENSDLVNLFEGLKMTESILMQTLKKHGLERLDPSKTGEKFNPNVHEATFQTKVEGMEDGDVFTTQQKGFVLNGRVVRAAKVGVVKNN